MMVLNNILTLNNRNGMETKLVWRDFVKINRTSFKSKSEKQIIGFEKLVIQMETSSQLYGCLSSNYRRISRF